MRFSTVVGVMVLIESGKTGASATSERPKSIHECPGCSLLGSSGIGQPLVPEYFMSGGENERLQQRERHVTFEHALNHTTVSIQQRWQDEQGLLGSAVWDAAEALAEWIQRLDVLAATRTELGRRRHERAAFIDAMNARQEQSHRPFPLPSLRVQSGSTCSGNGGGGDSSEAADDSQSANTGTDAESGSSRLPLAGKRVLELGAGVGLVSVTAALLGAEVTATDGQPRLLPLLRANARANVHATAPNADKTAGCSDCDARAGSSDLEADPDPAEAAEAAEAAGAAEAIAMGAGGGSVRVVQLPWGDLGEPYRSAVYGPAARQPFDVVLGADIVHGSSGAARRAHARSFGREGEGGGEGGIASGSGSGGGSAAFGPLIQTMLALGGEDTVYILAYRRR
jgi:predicted nicotinamide N-methyase